MSVTRYEVERVATVRDSNQGPSSVYTVIRTNPHKLIAAYETMHAAENVARALNQWAGSQYNP